MMDYIDPAAAARRERAEASAYVDTVEAQQKAAGGTA